MFARSMLLVLIALISMAGSGLGSPPSSSAADNGTPAAAPTPESLDAAVDLALRLELEGRNSDRNALLQKVLEDDPNHAAANWHLGRMKVGEAWVTYDRAVHEDEDRWHQLYLYSKNRSERGDTIIDHFYLADGARDREMRDEERAHLMRIVELEWDNREARERLGDVLVDGFWVTREEVEVFLTGVLRARQDQQVWGPQVQPIVRRLLRSRQRAWELARDELHAIRDPAAIPAVEAAFAGAEDAARGWYLEWLSSLDSWEASVVIARHALAADSPVLRADAQRRLQERRIDDYAPTLMALLRANPEVRSSLFATPLGGLIYVHQQRVETQDDVRVLNLAVLYGPERGTWFIRRGFVLSDSSSLMRNPGLKAWALRHLQDHYQALSPRQGRDTTSRVLVDNDRVTRTLASAIGHPELRTSQDWWGWWQNYQQVHVTGPKPQLQRDYEETWSVERQRGVSRTPSPDVRVQVNCSCFAAGTPVITEHGPKPIEEILLGDRVLAQDVETGEIAFKPVLKVTVRPPVELMKVVTEESELCCTMGHPFWVNSQDWLYARELSAGMRLHSIDGSEEITAVEDAGLKEQAYNLIVADFHTYFVGDDRVLSHDNTPRRPTNALVPGLQPDWSADIEADAVADSQ